MKAFIRIFKFVRKYISKYKWPLMLYVILGVAFYAMSMASPYILGVFIDNIGSGVRLLQILMYCGIYIAIAVLTILFTRFIKIFGTQLNIRVSTMVKARFFLHYQKVSPTERGKADAAGMADKINNDTEYLIIFILNVGQQLPGQLFCLMFALVFILHVSPWCAAAALAELPVMYALQKLFGDKIFKRSYDEQEARNHFFSALNEQVNQMESIRLHGIFDCMSARFFRRGKELEEKCVSNEKVSFLYGMINENMDVFLKIFLFIYGGISIVQGRMSIGNFTILYSYLAVITSAYAYFLTLHQQIQEHMVFYTRLKQIEELPEEKNGREIVDQIDRITVQNLTFSYGERQLFQKYHREFERGHLYCLAGENGAGKSTLAKLLLGLYMNQTGKQISYDDKKLEQLDMYEMRRSRIGVSEQEPVMLDDSIGFNIMYGEVTTKQREEIRHILGLLCFYNEDYHEEDMEKLLSADATTLSGGQKQKISITKALMKNPQLLLLDEPTSAMDEKGKKAFINFLKAYKSERIIIVISHDQELLDAADEVVQLG